jgi:hypothetical protein
MMVGKVTVWQCKCGMHIKVVAEAESEQLSMPVEISPEFRLKIPHPRF